jgi:hypothetical protein
MKMVKYLSLGMEFTLIAAGHRLCSYTIIVSYKFPTKLTNESVLTNEDRQ